VVLIFFTGCSEHLGRWNTVLRFEQTDQGIDIYRVEDKSVLARNVEHYSPKDRFVKVRRNNRWGVIDQNGQWLLPIEYEVVRHYEEHALFVVKKDGFWGAVDNDGLIRVPVCYDSISAKEEPGALWVISKDGLEGLIDPSNGAIASPLHNNLRVTALEASVTKQSDITETLTYTATVEKFEGGVWTVSTELTPTQEEQLQWYFIRNNDKGDTDINTDTATVDRISIEGLTASVNVDPDNMQRFGHAHCFVADVDEENGHAVTELVRILDVIDIRGKNVIAPDATEVDYRVSLNLEDATAEEIATLKVRIVETNADKSTVEKTATLKPDLTIKHVLEAGHKVQQIDVTVHPEGKEQNYVKATTYCRPLENEEVVNARIDNQDDTYIDSISDEIFTIRAETSLKDGTEVTVELDVISKDGSILATAQDKTAVSAQKIEHDFDIEKLIDDNDLNREEIDKFQGRIMWHEKSS
jgi:hypothetical protein